MIDFAFFGCWKQSGHFMHAEGGQSISDTQCEQNRVPLPYHLDASPLFLPFPEVTGHGLRTYLPSMNLTILSWWNNVTDTRGKVNSHILVRGDISVSTMWNVFNYRFKDVAVLHTKPLILASMF